MADEKTADGQTPGDAEGTVALAEFQKLQRKYDRRNRKMLAVEQRQAESEASQRRTEALLESVLEIMGNSDELVKGSVDEIRQRVRTQREHDTTFAGAEARLSQQLDEAGLDWQSEGLGEARRVLAEVNRTGNMALVPELEQLVKAAGANAGKPAGSTTTGSDDGDIESRIAAAVLADRQATGRVDTGQSTAATGRGNTRGDIAGIDVIKLGPKAAREEMTKIYDKAGIR